MFAIFFLGGSRKNVHQKGIRKGGQVVLATKRRSEETKRLSSWCNITYSN